MKKLLYTFTLALSALWGFGQDLSFHDFSTESLEGEAVSLSQYKGKKILVVNTASKCGLTGQYKDLEELYRKYGGPDFVIIGFPANNFKEQEPGTNAEIRSFCTENYGVSFPMMHKISVKGEDMDPIYRWLTQKSENGVEDSEVKWNFQKYMIDEEGHLVGHFDPMTKPNSKKIEEWIIQ